MLSEEPVGAPPCVCGRTNDRRIHCAHCGSFNVYAKSSLATKVKLDTGMVITNMMYHCRACGRDFNDLDRGTCKAPKASLSGRQRSVSGVVNIATMANPDLEGKTRAEKLQWVKDKLSKKGDKN